jgi:hypothetical protein
MMKFDLKQFGHLMIALAPAILLAAGVPPVLTGAVIHAATEAEAITGAKGVDKKAHLLAVIADSITVLNGAKGHNVINPTLALTAVSLGIDTTIASINLVKALPGHVAVPE